MTVENPNEPDEKHEPQAEEDTTEIPEAVIRNDYYWRQLYFGGQQQGRTIPRQGSVAPINQSIEEEQKSPTQQYGHNSQQYNYRQPLPQSNRVESMPYSPTGSYQQISGQSPNSLQPLSQQNTSQNRYNTGVYAIFNVFPQRHLTLEEIAETLHEQGVTAAEDQPGSLFNLTPSETPNGRRSSSPER